jgi:general secretion pathway protein B
MSFILDALKKSELERQRQAIPGLIDAAVPAARPGLPLWALVLAVLLAINLIVLGYVLFRHTRGGEFAGVAARAPTSAGTMPIPAGGENAAAPPADTPHFSPMDANPTYAPEIPVTEDAAPVADDTVRRGGTLHAEGGVANPRARPAEDPVQSNREAAADAATAASDEILPTLGELTQADSQGLPELHLDVHVYATLPADRFVYINNRKYREGATLAEGPRVARIRRDGVVLDYQGLRFLLPRQQ